MRNLSLLGATGSIGRSTLDLVRRYPEEVRVVGLTAHQQVAALAAVVTEFRPAVAAIADPALLPELMERVGATATELVAGPAGLEQVATLPECDTVLAAIVGGAGLAPTLAAARAGKDVALANKEALVMAGDLFLAEMAAGGGRLIPVDSEHSAVYQCLQGCRAEDVRRIILTASGGPFHGHPEIDLTTVTRAQALAHPNWSMGEKISIDSATLMNKGLEVIEARHLFISDGAEATIEVVVHPESIVHSIVELRDGQMLAQLGRPDMRGPIAYALTGPRRVAGVTERLDLTATPLHFTAPDLDRFPCLRLGFAALAAGGSLPCVLNGANETAVAAFLANRLPFTAIPAVIETAMAACTCPPPATLDEILALDSWARARASEAVAKMR
ncbi:MAG: 1-deoxy-D-xylulose-5-phosphate reductoisomerase [Deltaproteobacteria bacterium]|nr:1-deoxy-D-xylulose-5-phosphate reductoisomerase [Deltaproteobacteria bacterium]NCP96685.1 1-deoxy-D-xylulose-5-phosphate reductoisomerase [Deltaproteobacteria bacterium]NCS72908.1 1-deoxy-D-xylulose-5-phosphate reductoisomerase [Deltaproteobacteria bacterium]PIW82747.1 MAG: 1-deoxy-D-xylulose-5-phosphate reductoisomerase [Nitrospirae bacterium CG_4_8_14_3_um_filter_70_85]PIX83501.1 MAG: 1-deoxy-D-xylulose-5-phosphate reductoisomerase [Nitrospirae bacterium CG_4_10_14_3_um_filter_70_108]